MKSSSVLIILATFNSSKYLLEQLSSLFSQLQVQISIALSDDISNDNTREIVAQFCDCNRIPLLVIPNNEQSGSACNNFLLAIKQVSSTNHDYFALCDQDDIWLPNKLCRSIQLMIKSSADAYSS